MEAKGAISVGQKLGLQASGGTLEATMDDYILIYRWIRGLSNLIFLT